LVKIDWSGGGVLDRLASLVRLVTAGTAANRLVLEDALSELLFGEIQKRLNVRSMPADSIPIIRAK
jgi:hypothetical protein